MAPQILYLNDAFVDTSCQPVRMTPADRTTIRDDGVYVLGYARTPFAKFGGALREVRLPELGAMAVVEALRRSGVAASEIDEVVIGVNFPGSERSVARQVALRAEVPEDRVAFTVDRACCSSLAAISLSARALVLGEAETAVAGGAENLSRVPYFLTDMRWGKRLGGVTLTDQLVVACPYTGVPRAVQAAVEAATFAIGREEQDAWAFRSQRHYAQAAESDFFSAEVVPVVTVDERGRDVTFAVDEVPRPDTSLEALAALRTVNGSATVTAGNAPDLSSGASAIVLASGRRVKRDGLEPLAQIESWAMASGPPQNIASMPAEAAKLALARADVALDDVDVIEINEAFAAVPLVTTRALAAGDAGVEGSLRQRTNVNGGAIAIGHPTGATGARLVMTALSELARRGGGRGLITICGGIGEAEALVVRALAQSTGASAEEPQEA